MAQRGWTNIDFDRAGKKNKKCAKKCAAVQGRCDAKHKQCDGGYCNCSRCMKKILIIGGITKFKHIYVDLIESRGHKCIYLDGYLRRGEKPLEDKIMKCDMVFCPVDCNSHNACASAKRLCRKHGKPIKMLTSSSVTNMANAVKSIGL